MLERRSLLRHKQQSHMNKRRGGDGVLGPILNHHSIAEASLMGFDIRSFICRQIEKEDGGQEQGNVRHLGVLGDRSDAELLFD